MERHGARVLVVDDEPDLLAEVKPLLERAGFQVLTARDGREALERIEREAPDLVVLDIRMPGLNGREVLQRMRQAGNWTPVLFLSYVGASAERALALLEGADDYLNKPFEPVELIARIQAILRRTRKGQPSLAACRWLRSGELLLDRLHRQARKGEQPLNLTPRAFAVLEYLMLHPGEPIARERLLDAVWGWSEDLGTRAVDVRIAELRRALGEDPEAPRWIETVVGFGYRFRGEVEGQP
ncbi:MAG: response regulator transcription factor [Anaerolineae bacterium]|nr:response regulator transcription factor [Anaerolineae bacterium]